MRTRTHLLAVILSLAAPLICAQPNPPQPTFEAVSIKPCQDPRVRQLPGDTYPPRGTSTPGHLRTGCFPLLDDNGMGLIRAYALDPFTPIQGGPSWIHSAFYQIDAVADGDPSVKTMMGPMMQALLEDHFHLKIHRQTGEGPVYFLSVARGGPKLHPFTEGSCKPWSESAPPTPPAGQQYCLSLIGAGSHPSILDQGVTLDDFSRQLLAVLSRPVLNKTNLPGRFDIHLDFSREGSKLAGIPLAPPAPSADGNSAASDPSTLPSIFTAVQEQLGLKLEPGKGPVEVLVIDHIERPTTN